MQAEHHYLVIEPFYGGSHKQLIETVFGDAHGLQQSSAAKIYTLPAKKWHWKARTSALYFAQHIDKVPTECKHLTIFASSVLNLAELIALRPDLAKCRKLIYFHENQLQYPLQKGGQQRDFQYGYNQILSCLVADVILFNSHFNINSFLDKIPSFLKKIPDGRTDGQRVVEEVKAKSQVLYYGIEFPPVEGGRRGQVLHIVWPHRWEHDKDPDTFFQVLEELKMDKLEFRVSVLGEQYKETPGVFVRMKSLLADYIVEWGYVESKEKYYQVLSTAHVVVSTAMHEFFGVAMLEAVHLGCYPLAPDNLVYPEHFPEVCLYRTKAQLAKKLRYFCRYPHKTSQIKLDVSKYSWKNMKAEYDAILAG